MSNYNSLSKDAQADALYDISKTNKDSIDSVIEILQEIKKDGKVSEKNFRNITSVMRELDAMRELFIVRLLNSMKRGTMLLD
tara:strand:+ start:2571 stop:2816 length:246 start_codon:yes stop_codon:yes gene_type:complete